MIVTCERCGKEINRSPSQVGAHVYCSRQCKYGERITVNCSNCGKELIRPPSLVRESNFCSYACHNEYQRKTNPKPVKIRVCPACGKEFVKDFGRGARTKYCSDDCAHTANFTETKCAHCGKSIIRRKESVKMRQNFCGRHCASEHKKTTFVLTLGCTNCGKEYVVTERMKSSKAKKLQEGEHFCTTKCRLDFDRRERKSNSVFRRILSRKKDDAARRGIEFSITAEDIQRQFDAQNGCCSYTGKRLSMCTGKSDPYSLSIDRIDSSKGYIPGNIELVSVIANYAKNHYSREVLIEFALLVAKKYG